MFWVWGFRMRENQALSFPKFLIHTDLYDRESRGGLGGMLFRRSRMSMIYALHMLIPSVKACHPPTPGSSMQILITFCRVFLPRKRDSKPRPTTATFLIIHWTLVPPHNSQLLPIGVSLKTPLLSFPYHLHVSLWSKLVLVS